MALLPGSAGIGQQLTKLASRMTPPKVTQGLPVPDFGAGMTDALDPETALFTPPKTTNFTGMFSDPTALDPVTGTPKKFNVADLFGAPPVSGPVSPEQVAGMQNGTLGTLGGQYAVLDQYDQAFAQAAAAHGGGQFDANWLKALAAMEGGWGAGAVSGAGALGIMQIMPGGYPALEAQYPLWRTDPTQNIGLGAAILAAKIQENGGSRDMGTQRYLGVGTDPYTGVTTGQYLANITGYWNQLNQSGGSFGGNAGGGGGTSPQPINGQWGGNSAGNAVVQEALKFVGLPYVWGGIPGKGVDPRAFGGWDCSGFTYWLDQNYGTGQLPMGSHYQYQYAQQRGGLFMDMNQLQPGDLIFWDTGWQGGAGAELNRAGHVGIYIGNGQMMHAANQQAGTIISNLSGYNGGQFIGAMHSSYSGGGGGVPGVGAPQQAAAYQPVSFRNDLRAFQQGLR